MSPSYWALNGLPWENRFINEVEGTIPQRPVLIPAANEDAHDE